MSARRTVTVTTPQWSVSACTSYHSVGAVLSVFRGFHKGRPRYGDHNGRTFPTSEDAFAFALEHGYLQPYRVGFCALCRRQHWFCGGRMGNCSTAAGRPYDGCTEAQTQFDATRPSAQTTRPKRARRGYASSAYKSKAEHAQADRDEHDERNRNHR